MQLICAVLCICLLSSSSYNPDPDPDSIRISQQLTACMLSLPAKHLTESGTERHLISNYPIRPPRPAVTSQLPSLIAPLTRTDFIVTPSQHSISAQALIGSGSAGNFIFLNLLQELNLKKWWYTEVLKIHSILGKWLGRGATNTAPHSNAMHWMSSPGTSIVHGAERFYCWSHSGKPFDVTTLLTWELEYGRDSEVEWLSCQELFITCQEMTAPMFRPVSVISFQHHLPELHHHWVSCDCQQPGNPQFQQITGNQTTTTPAMVLWHWPAPCSNSTQG